MNISEKEKEMIEFQNKACKLKKCDFDHSCEECKYLYILFSRGYLKPFCDRFYKKMECEVGNDYYVYKEEYAFVQ